MKTSQTTIPKKVLGGNEPALRIVFSPTFQNMNSEKFRSWEKNENKFRSGMKNRSKQVGTAPKL